MCSKTAWSVIMLSREGVPRSERVSLPLTGHFFAQYAVAYSTFYTDVEVFSLKCVNCFTSMYVITTLFLACLGVLDLTALIDFFMNLLRG